MTVSTLIAQLAKMPPDAQVVLSATDHHYRRLSTVTHDKAEQTKRRQLCEYYTPDQMQSGGQIVDVVVLS